MTLEEEEDWGRKMTGALKWTLRAIRVLRSASSFTPDAAFSAAWTVTSARASLASWKLLMNAWDKERIENNSVRETLLGVGVGIQKKWEQGKVYVPHKLTECIKTHC